MKLAGILSLAWHWIKLTVRQSQPSSDSERRYVRIIQGILSGLAGRGISVLTAFISVPLTIRYLGTERYAVWVLLSTLLAWINLSEFGLGNGLLNAVSRAVSNHNNQLARTYISTAIAMLSGVACVAFLLVSASSQFINLSSLFNIQSETVSREAAHTILVAIAIFLFSLPLSAVPRIYLAHQEASLANFWASAGNLASLIGLLIVTYNQGGLVWLTIGVSGSILMVNLISALWLFLKHKPWLMPQFSLVNRAIGSELFGVGQKFFIINIASLLILETDNFVIAHFLGPESVVKYSVAWRLFSYTTLLQTLATSSLWPAYSEAFARNDAKWIFRTFGMNLKLSIALTTLFVLPLVLFGQPIIGLWAGPDAIPPFALLVGMGIWSVTSASMSAIACLLNSSGNIKGQAIYGTITAVASVVLSIILVQQFGIVGVIAATTIAYLIFNVGPTILETRMVLGNLQK